MDRQRLRKLTSRPLPAGRTRGGTLCGACFGPARIRRPRPSPIRRPRPSPVRPGPRRPKPPPVLASGPVQRHPGWASTRTRDPQWCQLAERWADSRSARLLPEPLEKRTTVVSMTQTLEVTTDTAPLDETHRATNETHSSPGRLGVSAARLAPAQLAEVPTARQGVRLTPLGPRRCQPHSTKVTTRPGGSRHSPGVGTSASEGGAKTCNKTVDVVVVRVGREADAHPAGGPEAQVVAALPGVEVAGRCIDAHLREGTADRLRVVPVGGEEQRRGCAAWRCCARLPPAGRAARRRAVPAERPRAARAPRRRPPEPPGDLHLWCCWRRRP